METPRHRFVRLVDALDTLVAQETATLQQGDLASLPEIQQRAEPVVAGLAELGLEVADAQARAQIAALLARRQRNLDFIEDQLATARAELAAVRESEHRLTRLAPAYGRPPRDTVRRLQASG